MIRFESDGERTPRYQVEETEMDRLRNSVVGSMIFCTLVACATAVVCAFILR